MAITNSMLQEAADRSAEEEIIAYARWLASGKAGAFLMDKLRTRGRGELAALIGSSPGIADDTRAAAIAALAPRRKYRVVDG